MSESDESSSDEDYVPSSKELKELEQDNINDSSIKAENQMAIDNSEEKSQRRNDLWASFLKDVSKSKPSLPLHSKSGIADSTVSSKSASSFATSTPKTKTKFFDFAGEKISVEVKTSQKELDQTKSSPPKPKKRQSDGMSAVLQNLKVPKLSTLEKSKLDWESFKDKEGISEELAAHNRGKDGYLAKQDFLQDADQMQFEMEKLMRQRMRESLKKF